MKYGSESTVSTSSSSSSSSGSVLMRSFTLRKVIMIVAFLALIKIGWNLIFGSPHHKIMLDVTDLELQPLEFEFQPQSCVMEDGECKPFNEARAPVAAKGLLAHGDSFYLDGRPFRILSGSFHYFRTQPAHWGDRLLKMKAAGLNTVTTYIPWNLNEKMPGAYNFGGRWDLATFIQQVQKVGLKLIIRPGPFICAEWEYGGLPSWLLRDPAVTVRSSSSKAYMTAVENYFSKLLPMLATFGYKRGGGGPIIAFQIENEYGSYGHDPQYLNFLKDMYIKYGIEELLFTSDGQVQLSNGTLPGILATVNFAKRPAEAFKALQNFQPNKPLMVTEFWAGWFDHWGEEHHAFDPADFEKRLTEIFKHNASVNFYMFVGGTNFGFWNGANMDTEVYLPTVTSYDYDAPITENGDTTEKFNIIRKMIMKHDLGPVDWIDVPPNVKSATYGKVEFLKSLDYNEMMPILTDKIETLDNLVTMEKLNINNHGGQGYGWILYRTLYTLGKTLTLEGEVKDYAQIMVNGKEVDRITWKTGLKQIALPESNLKENVLDIFVENSGRVNFKHRTNKEDILDQQHKGIKGRVLIDGKVQTKWQHVPYEFNHYMRETLKNQQLWKPLNMQSNVPTAYYATFNVGAHPTDTFIDVEGWGKGIVLINGYNIGRYWVEEGPQRRLYVPGPLLLEGQNEVILFELINPGKSVAFVDKPGLE